MLTDITQICYNQGFIMFEVIAVWEGQFYMHQCLDAKEAKEWAECYQGHENCKIRIWQMF